MALLKLIFCTLLAASLFGHETKLLITMVRHGARYSMTQMDGKFYRAQLTTFGALTCFGLGQTLRKLYPNLFPQVYNPTENYIVTSSQKRTQNTAEALMDGIYPHNSFPKTARLPDHLADPGWEQEVRMSSVKLPQNGLQIIPFQSLFPRDDYMINPANSKVCPGLKKFRNQESKTDPEVLQLIEEMREMLPKFKTNFFNPDDMLKHGEMTTRKHFNSAVDYINSQVHQHNELDISQTLIDEANMLHSMDIYLHFFKNKERSTYQITEWSRRMAQILRQFKQDFENGKPHLKFALFSTHSRLLMNYLVEIGVFRHKCLKTSDGSPRECDPLPPFASTFTFDVYEKEKRLFVEGQYNGKIIPICNGEGDCTLDDFISTLEKMGLQGSIDELRQKYCLAKPKSKNKVLKMITFFNVVVIVSLSALVWVIKSKLK